MNESQKKMVEYKKLYKILHTVWFHLHEIPEESQLAYGDRYNNSACL